MKKGWLQGLCTHGDCVTEQIHGDLFHKLHGIGAYDAGCYEYSNSGFFGLSRNCIGTALAAIYEVVDYLKPYYGCKWFALGIDKVHF